MEKFTYRLKQTPLNLESDNHIEDYLLSLGIRKTSSFLQEPDIYDEEAPKHLENIDALVDELHNGFINKKYFFLQIDSDVDGYTSATIFYKYFKDLYPDCEIEYRVHNGKEHGVIVDTVPFIADYVIIPDAGSNQTEEQTLLSKMGKKVLIIDHHSVDNFVPVKNVIVVNNQLSPRFNNKSLSGAGMVYKVIQHYSYKYGNKISHRQYIDLAAFGIISDMMDTRELDNNYIIYYGLREIRNPMLKALLTKQSYSVTSTTLPNKIDIAFYITPLVNAVIRVGTVEENLELFSAFVESDHTETYTKTFRGKTTNETFYERVSRIAYNIRNQQNKEKEKAMEFLNKGIKAKGMDKNMVVIGITSNEDEVTVPKTMTGLVAMDLVKNYKKPCLVLRPKNVNGETHYYGSGRANMRPGFESFRNVLNESGLVEYAQGHDMAFGAGVKDTNLNRLIDYLNNRLKDIDFGSEEIEVDAILKWKQISPSLLYGFANFSHLYGTGIPQPKFAFEIMLTRDLIKVIGKEGSTMKFSYNNIDFIKFNAKELISDIFKEDDNDGFLTINPKYRFKIIGRAQINEFNGNKSLQILIDNISYEEFNEFLL